MDKTFLIGISGPPRSGKDTLAVLLHTHFWRSNIQTEIQSLSMPMRLAVYGMMGFEYTREHYEEHKDDALMIPGKPNWTSIRKEMISLSEDHVKPRLGHGWWGNALLNRVKPGVRLIIVPDMGFDAEHDVFAAVLSDCLWIHLHREGKDFSNDSRKYVGKGPAVHNNRTPGMAADRIIGHVDAMGWFR